MAEETSIPDEDRKLPGIDDQTTASSQLDQEDFSAPDASPGNPSPTFNIEHAPADTRRNSRSSFTSNQSISDRGDAEYEQFHSDHCLPPIEPPKSGRSVDLQDALFAQQVSMEGGKGELYKCFFPKGALDQIITPEIVKDSVRESIQKRLVQPLDSNELQQYADKVCGTVEEDSIAKSFRNMFAILLLTDAPWLIIDFVDEDLNDGDLPLEIDSTSAKRHLHRKSQPAKDILPWTKKWKVRSYGGHSKVCRVGIHENHHGFGERKDSDGTFAVKKLRYEEDQSGAAVTPSPDGSKHDAKTFEERARQLFRDEVEVLGRFSNDAHAHTHLISLLAAFQRGHSCYLLFDWAHSDLLQFWKTTTPRPPLEEQNVKWLIEQMHGISDGLYRIHTYRLSSGSFSQTNIDTLYGRHGDIKPQNLLIFKKEQQSFQESVIKLTDFGLTIFHSETSRSGIRQSKVAGWTPSYRPPELDLEDATISRSFDIWSLGCVFLEFITWHFGGWPYLHKFALKRQRKDIISGHKLDQFFEFVQNEETKEYGLRVKYEVLQWISELHKREDCSDLMHDMLDFIEKRMLAVIPPLKNTDQSNARAKIEEVLEKFKYFKDRLGETEYSLTGHSKSTAIDESAISVSMTLEASIKDELRKGIFEVRRGNQELKATTARRSKTGF
ncbi:hypothetical protein E8E14_000116 [Neopestalotiopsis sp. 37M]|nr:hypothetical protein E8E14_000116 [Neopestalotiopsis sp. 37M]